MYSFYSFSCVIRLINFHRYFLLLFLSLCFCLFFHWCELEYWSTWNLKNYCIFKRYFILSLFLLLYFYSFLLFSSSSSSCLNICFLLFIISVSCFFYLLLFPTFCLNFCCLCLNFIFSCPNFCYLCLNLCSFLNLLSFCINFCFLVSTSVLLS